MKILYFSLMLCMSALTFHNNQWTPLYQQKIKYANKVPLDSLKGTWYGEVDYESTSKTLPSEEETWTISIDKNRKIKVVGFMDEVLYRSNATIKNDSVFISSVGRNELAPNYNCWAKLKWDKGILKGTIKRDTRVYVKGVSKGIFTFKGQIILSKK